MKLHDLAVALNALAAKVTALIAAPNAPPAPVVLTAGTVTSNSIFLDWGDAPPTGLISYTVYRSTNDAAFFAFPPFTGSPPSSNLLDGGLTPATKYAYFVVSTNSFGTSAPSNTVTRTTTGADTTPDQFTFVDQTNVALSSLITSAPITVTGINAAAVISIANGTYSINGGPFVSASGTVNNNDQVRAQHTSSSSGGTSVNTTVTIGGVSDTFTSTTSAANQPPVWSSGTLQFDIVINVPMSLDLNTLCSDPEGQALNYSLLIPPLPTGLSLVGSVVSGTPTVIQQLSPTFRADDAQPTVVPTWATSPIL